MREIYRPLTAIVETVGVELGLTLNTLNIMNSVDKDARQIGFLIRETCEDLLTRKPWKKIIGTNPWVIKADQSMAYALVDDTDVPMFDSRIIQLGAKWRFLNSKGFTYDEVFRFYERRINDFAFDYNAGEMVNTNAQPATVSSRS